jgi:hypothetical protein
MDSSSSTNSQQRAPLASKPITTTTMAAKAALVLGPPTAPVDELAGTMRCSKSGCITWSVANSRFCASRKPSPNPPDPLRPCDEANARLIPPPKDQG